jgi:ATP-dependent Zn protease
VQRIIEECSQRTRAIIRERREAITNLASTLLEKETLDVSQIRKVLGERPFPLKENFRAYLEESTGQ